MRSVLRGILLLVAASSCAHSSLSRGEPRSLPEGWMWCSEETREKYASQPKRPIADDCGIDDNEFCRTMSARFTSACGGRLAEEMPDGGASAELILGISSDATGKFSGICMITSDLGEAPGMLECVQQTLHDWP